MNFDFIKKNLILLELSGKFLTFWIILFYIISLLTPESILNFISKIVSINFNKSVDTEKIQGFDENNEITNIEKIFTFLQRNKKEEELYNNIEKIHENLLHLKNDIIQLQNDLHILKNNHQYFLSENLDYCLKFGLGLILVGISLYFSYKVVNWFMGSSDISNIQAVNTIIKDNCYRESNTHDILEILIDKISLESDHLFKIIVNKDVGDNLRYNKTGKALNQIYETINNVRGSLTNAQMKLEKMDTLDLKSFEKIMGDLIKSQERLNHIAELNYKTLKLLSNLEIDEEKVELVQQAVEQLSPFL